MIRYTYLFLLLCGGLSAQELLTKDKALQLTMDNNFDIKIAKGNKDIAANNATLLNSGYFPVISASSGATFNNQDSQTTFRQGETTNLTGVETNNYQASIKADYTVFDGLGRMYNYKKFQKEYGLSEIETEEAIGNTVVQLFTVYYEVARLSENVLNLETTLEVSKERLRRTKTAVSYAQKTGLDVLNAEVDINNDSINYINAIQQLRNYKRDLNLIMNRDLDQDYQIDTLATLLPSNKMLEIYQKADEKNYAIRKSKSNIDISEMNYKYLWAQFLPKIGLMGSYGWNHNVNSPVSFVTKNTSNGFSYGANLNWTIFGGGKGTAAIKTQKIRNNIQELRRQQIEKQVERDIKNSWQSYINAKYIFEARKKTVQTNRDNFERTRERYNLGQITSVEFRQAQLNLFNAINQKNKAKYDAKNAELKMLLITGYILDIDF